MIEDKNDGQEYDKWEKWQYDRSKSKIHKENYGGDNRKRHKKKKRKSTGMKGNKEGDKKNHEKEYDQWKKWQYDEIKSNQIKSKIHEKSYDGNDRKRHKKKKRKSTSKKENKEN